MNRSFHGSMLLVAILVSSTVNAEGQPAVGLQVPPLLLPTFLVSYMISETELLELNVSYQSSRQSAVLSVAAHGKLFLNSTEVATLAITPFLGAGARIVLVSMHVLEQSFSTVVASVNILFGVEYLIPDSRLHIFAEAIHGIALSLPGAAVGGVLGVWLEL